MAEIHKVTVAQALGLKPSAMLTLRKRGNVWWAYWRGAQRRQRFRSTGKIDYAQAMRAAAMLVIADTEALAPAEDKPRTDATFDEVIGWFEEFVGTVPLNRDETPPQTRTARGYIQRTRRLVRASRSATVGDLRAQAPKLTAHRLGVCEGSFRTIMRGTGAGLFWEGFLAWLKREKRVELNNPLLGSIPPVGVPIPFRAWTPGEVNSLKQHANKDLKEQGCPHRLSGCNDRNMAPTQSPDNDSPDRSRSSLTSRSFSRRRVPQVPDLIQAKGIPSWTQPMIATEVCAEKSNGWIRFADSELPNVFSQFLDHVIRTFSRLCVGSCTIPGAQNVIRRGHPFRLRRPADGEMRCNAYRLGP